MKNISKLKVSTLTSSNTRKLQKIRDYLIRTPEGATPKMIATATGLNVNTIKSILPKMANLKLVTRGWYKVVNRGDGPIQRDNPDLTDWTFHNLILSSQIPDYTGEQWNTTYSFNLINCKFNLSKSGKATLHVGADNPLNVSSICMVYAYFRELIFNKFPYSITQKNTIIRTIEFNKDYKNLRLDGIKCITLDNLITHFKIYQKSRTLRKEHKTKIPFNTNNIIDMLTQNPNELELTARMEEQNKQLTKLTIATVRNYQLVTTLINKMNKEG